MTGPDPLPRVAVVFDFGSATPMSILASARGLAEIVFLCDRNLPHVRALFDDIRTLARVCDITGLTDDRILAAPDCAGLAGITTFSESRIARTAALAERLGLCFLDRRAAAAVTDKYTQRRLLAEAGVQHTECRVVRDPAGLDTALDTVGLPAVLKPRRGAASARTCTVHTRQEAAAQLRAFTVPGGGEFVVERLLPGDPSVAGREWADYVSVESVISHGVIRHVEVTGKFPLAPPLRETGYVVPSTLGEDMRARVLHLAGAALVALGIRHGIAHTEVKLTPDGPRIIEVNGRLGGYVADLVRRARGFDLVRAALTVALGRTGDTAATTYRRHAFQYFLTPPMDAVAVRRLDGLDDLGRVPGIRFVETFAEPGTVLDWRRGTLTYLGIVHGSAPDHPGVLRLVDLVHRTLRIEYDHPPRGAESGPA
ncbi:ATP-grasp domain-containing protein [Actinoplanes sp. NPDC023801]|uniref:ATP-grasp domain-containing protein n=1 Tax=Actinoplanes sp. NPDC023801 TaxID=3154595 RepID=UPI0034046D0F